MEFLSSSCLLSVFAVLIFVLRSEAIPDDNAAATNPSIPDDQHKNSNVEEEEISPEDAELNKQINELFNQHCGLLMGECWLFYKLTKPYLQEDHRVKLCLKRTRGWRNCEEMSDADSDNAIQEAEERTKAKSERLQIGSERRQRLLTRKKDITEKMNLLTRHAAESRAYKNNIVSTTEFGGFNEANYTTNDDEDSDEEDR